MSNIYIYMLTHPISKNMKGNTRLAIIIGLAVIIAAVGYWWISNSTQTVQIQQKGSDTLLILAQNWAETYIEKNRNTVIVVSGGGSGTGISALINKQIDIADASREIKQTEIDSAKDNGVNPVEWKVALDGISVIVNVNNPIGELSYSQIRGIYNGDITNWSEISGEDGVVVAYGRQSTSGTYVYFNEEVLEEDDYRADKQQLAGNAEIVEAVINDPNGIGYVGVAYAEVRRGELKIVSVSKADADMAYQPTSANIASGDYPISRYLYIYTDGIPEGAVADYIEFILSSEGQEIASEVGYIALPQAILREQLDKLG
jgi:phosphate transport system substrate-binding protein